MLQARILKLSQHVCKIYQQSSGFRPFHVSRAPLLAGHSKWANIRHIKAEKDGQKAAMFTKLSRQIRLAIQEGGGSTNVEVNSILRSVVDEAVRKNMPMVSIQNILKKSDQNLKELKKFYVELKYKHKVFAIVVVYADNLACVKMDLAPIARKAGASFSDTLHMFDDYGVIEAIVYKNVIKLGLVLEEQATEDAIECGAEEIEIVDEIKGIVNFICRPSDMLAIRSRLEGLGYKIQNTEHIFAPNTTVALTPDEQLAYEKFVKKVQALPGVEDIYDNVEASEIENKQKSMEKSQ